MPDPKESKGPSEPRKGGFGAFEQKYRDRWAAEHPNAGKAKPAGDQPEPSTGTDASDGEPDRAGKE